MEVEINSHTLLKDIASTLKRKLNGVKGPEKEMLQFAEGGLVLFLVQMKLFLHDSFEMFIDVSQLPEEATKILQNRKFQLAVADLQRRVTVTCNPDLAMNCGEHNFSPVVMKGKGLFEVKEK